MRTILFKMTEVHFVQRYLSNNVNTYLEWGSGGSTYYFPQYVKRRVVSIEHDRRWCEQVRSNVSKSEGDVRVEVHCVEIPRGTLGWGLKSPFEEGNYVVFRKYIDEIDVINQPTWDFVFIDGRARVDASIKALSYIRNDSIVMLHDTWRILYKYRPILDYYDVKDQTYTAWNQGVAALIRKPKYAYLQGDHAAVQTILNDKYGL